MMVSIVLYPLCIRHLMRFYLFLKGLIELLTVGSPREREKKTEACSLNTAYFYGVVSNGNEMRYGGGPEINYS